MPKDGRHDVRTSRRRLTTASTFLPVAALRDNEVFRETREIVEPDGLHFSRMLSAGKPVATARTLRAWESGTREVPGSAALALAFLAQGQLEEAGGIPLPSHIVQAPDAQGYIWVHRLRTPRFYAVLAPMAVTADAVRHPNGLVLSVVLWIDEPAPERLPGLAALVPIVRPPS